MALINKKQEYQDQEDWSNDIEKLKGYKEFKENVEYWYKQTNDDRPIIQGSYEILWDDELGWCVDVDGSVNLWELNIKEIPFQFRNVSSDFYFRRCKNLTSLKGCPIYIGNNFGCINNEKITSLIGCPKYVGGNFGCWNCGKRFTKEYIRSLCKIKGRIIV